MSQNSKRLRMLVAALLVTVATNFAISYASSSLESKGLPSANPTTPNLPRP